MKKQTPTRKKGVEKTKEPEQPRSSPKKKAAAATSTPLGTPVDGGSQLGNKVPKTAPAHIQAPPSQRQASSSQRRPSLLSQKRRSEPIASAIPKRLLATPKQQQQKMSDGESMPPPPPSGGSKPSIPPTTVAEAQELGEQARLQDDTMWALEGLTSSSVAAQKDSLAALAEIYAHRRSRLALHTSAIGGDVLKAIANLQVQDDTVLALGCATMLLLLGQSGCDPIIFARDEVATLAASLLETTGILAPRNGIPPPAVRMLRVLHDPSLARLLPREASFSPLSVTLAVLSNTLDPHNTTIDIEPIKHTLRRCGVLRATAQVAAGQARTLVDPSPTMETVQGLWKLQHSLLVLEHSCFACMENEGHLVGMEVSQGCPPVVTRLPLVQWLVQQLQVLSRQTIVAGLKKDCLRGLLAVLMNTTQNNAPGCARVVGVGGMEGAAQTLVKIALGGPNMKGALNSSEDLNSWVDEVSGCLGLLINLVEHSRELRTRMRSLKVATGPGNDAEVRLVPLLSSLMSTAIATGAGTGGAAAVAAEKDTNEVTLDTLKHGEGEAVGSIVEVYAAILLGFLVEGDKEAQAEAGSGLPGGTIAPVVAAIRRCFQFYVTAGALTEHTETSLRDLLASLQGSM